MQLLRYMCAAKFDTAQRKDTVVVLHYTGCPKKTWEFSDEFDIVFLNNS